MSSAYRVELCRSDLGDGGWSLHACIDGEEEWPLLVSGESGMDADGAWTRPSGADYERAQERARELAAQGRKLREE